MRKLIFAAVVGGSLLVALVAGSFALAKNEKGGNVKARLIGYNEVASISTAARGTFRAHIDPDSHTIEYTLTYEGIEGGAASASHIHLGQRHTNGGVSAFLCGGSKPACPATGGTVHGTIVPADVIGPAGQGIAPGEFNELVHAMRAGATYANVHSTTYGGGEIRGQIRGKKDKD